GQPAARPDRGRARARPGCAHPRRAVLRPGPDGGRDHARGAARRRRRGRPGALLQPPARRRRAAVRRPRHHRRRPGPRQRRPRGDPRAAQLAGVDARHRRRHRLGPRRARRRRHRVRRRPRAVRGVVAGARRPCAARGRRARLGDQLRPLPPSPDRDLRGGRPMSTLQQPTRTQPAATDHARVSFSRAVTIVAKREIMVRLRSKAFVISTIIFLAAILASVVLATQAGSLFSSTTSVAATADAAATVAQLPDVEVTEVASAEEVRELVADGTVAAGVVGSPTEGFTVIGDRTAPEGIIQALSVTPQVELLDPDAPNPMLTYFIGLGFGLVFFMSAMTYGSTIAQSDVEEQQTRIVEILLAAIPARALLAGKVIGNSLLAFAQIALVALIVVGTGAATGDTVLLDGLGIPVLW